MELEAEPMGSFYVFLSLSNLPEPLRDGMDFFRAALEHQVIVVPGEFFDVNPGKRRGHIPSRLKQHVRLSFGPSAAVVDLGLERLASMIEGQD
jgi:aspartate/methionine/tyrosine aminotransferase